MGYIAVSGTERTVSIVQPGGSKLAVSVTDLAEASAWLIKNMSSSPAGSKAYFNDKELTFTGSSWVIATGSGFSLSSIASGLQSIFGAIIGGSKPGTPAPQQSSSFPIVPVAIAGVAVIAAVVLLKRKRK